jgi:hypothetical protein
MIRKLTAYKIGQAVRDDGPQTHLIKTGTPTMGGALILVSVAVTTLLWADLTNRYVWIVLLTTLGFGAVGWVDDWRKVVHRNPKGLSAKAKIFWQSLIALTGVAFLAYSAKLPQQTELIVPFFKTVAIPLGTVGFMILGYFVVVGTSNAVNLTDGLDGLAIMPTVMIASALAVFAYVSGHAGFSKYLGFPLISGAGELAVLCGAMAGAGHGGPRRAPGDRAADHGRRLRGRDPLRDHPGRELPPHGQARLPHGAAAPPLRIEGLEGEPGRREVLDHHDDARPSGSFDAEASVSAMKKRNTGETGAAQGTQRETCVVRSWLRRTVSRKDHLTLCALCDPCSLCVSLGLVKPKVER